MTLYVLRRSDDEPEPLALLRGPAGAEVGKLARTFSELYDHGDLLAQACCVHLASPGPPGCVHEQERAAIRAWRTEQGWPDDDAAGAFVVWLCSVHGFAPQDYTDVRLEDLRLVEGLRAHVRVTYDPAYNGPGGLDYTPMSKGTLRTVYMPAAHLRHWVSASPEQQIRAWLRRTLLLSEGNLVGYDLRTLYDKDGHPLAQNKEKRT